MFKNEYSTTRNLPINQLSDPKYFRQLRKFAEDTAPSCIAKALLAWLDRPQQRTDKRKDNNPHRTAEAKGAQAAENHRPLSACPYKAPQFRNSWLKGYQRAKQIILI